MESTKNMSLQEQIQEADKIVQQGIKAYRAHRFASKYREFVKPYLEGINRKNPELGIEIYGESHYIKYARAMREPYSALLRLPDISRLINTQERFIYSGQEINCISELAFCIAVMLSSGKKRTRRGVEGRFFYTSFYMYKRMGEYAIRLVREINEKRTMVLLDYNDNPYFMAAPQARLIINPMRYPEYDGPTAQRRLILDISYEDERGKDTNLEMELRRYSGRGIDVYALS